MSKDKSNKISKKMLLGWPTRTISIGAATTLISYATYYATDILGLSAAAVGMMFVVSKIFDGFTDFVAGTIIDKTHSKLGKARPYELALIGMWLFVVLYFCAPQTSKTAALIYLFVMYTIAFSVFSTFLNCNDSVYLANALKDKSQSTTITAVSGLVSTAFALVINMILPQLVKTVGTTREGWRKISIILGIVYTLVGLIRFFTIKEIKQDGAEAAQKLSVKDLVVLLFKNKYILMIAAVTFIGNILTSIGVGTYYNKYIIGNIGVGSLLSLAMLSTIIAVAVVPALAKKFTLRRTLQLMMLIGLAGYLIRLIDVHSVLLLFISSFFGMLAATMPLAFVAPLAIDCMDYGEWKNGKRSEGMLSCATSITTKIGGALGVGMTGVLMNLAGYNGTLSVQSSGAENMIIALSSYIPAILAAVIIIIFQFYNLDDKIVKIRAELAQRHGKENASA